MDGFGKVIQRTRERTFRLTAAKVSEEPTMTDAAYCMKVCYHVSEQKVGLTYAGIRQKVLCDLHVPSQWKHNAVQVTGCNRGRRKSGFTLS
jgi:hypothetical protein